MGPVRVTAIASLTPLEELDADPFLVDSRSQHAMCARWAAERGYIVSRELLVRGLRADHCVLWDGVRPGTDLFVVAGVLPALADDLGLRLGDEVPVRFVVGLDGK